MSAPAKVRYRSLAGSIFDAVVVAERADGRVDIEVLVPGATAVTPITRIKLVPDANACRDGECFPLVTGL